MILLRNMEMIVAATQGRSWLLVLRRELVLVHWDMDTTPLNNMEVMLEILATAQTPDLISPIPRTGDLPMTVSTATTLKVAATSPLQHPPSIHIPNQPPTQAHPITTPVLLHLVT